MLPQVARGRAAASARLIVLPTNVGAACGPCVSVDGAPWLEESRGKFPIGNVAPDLRPGSQVFPDRENRLDISCRSGDDIPDREHRNMTIEEIGSAVRQARLAQGLRQDQLAAAAGVGLRFLVELERGKPTVRLDKVLAVLSALGCRLDVTPRPVPAGSDA